MVRSCIKPQGAIASMHTTSVSLLERLREPNQASAWNRFVELYTPLLLYWARRTGLQPQDAADLVQEIFVLLVQKLPEFKYQKDRNFRGWLRTVLMNKWRNRLRDNAKNAGNANSAELSGLVGDNALESLWDQEHQQLMTKRALELMQADFEPKTWKACWGLVVEGRSGAELAKELGLSENAVYIAKWRVLRRLREELAGLID